MPRCSDIAGGGGGGGGGTFLGVVGALPAAALLVRLLEEEPEARLPPAAVPWLRRTEPSRRGGGGGTCTFAAAAALEPAGGREENADGPPSPERLLLRGAACGAGIAAVAAVDRGDAGRTADGAGSPSVPGPPYGTAPAAAVPVPAALPPAPAAEEAAEAAATDGAGRLALRLMAPAPWLPYEAAGSDTRGALAAGSARGPGPGGDAGARVEDAALATRLGASVSLPPRMGTAPAGTVS